MKLQIVLLKNNANDNLIARLIL